MDYTINLIVAGNQIYEYVEILKIANILFGPYPEATLPFQV